ncbi:hypothetical protein OUZ56_026404 [Daphnia magna]|uniref:Uncharacterized protein n=1 Tax=Daphnia magna TaxID=35525 RepID=A0ABQ9ZLQ3_9CRUS|nr:hypothetical protein OUZ56_026404 [Daphnia magna]
MIAALSKERMTHLCEEITNFPFHPRQYHTITKYKLMLSQSIDITWAHIKEINHIENKCIWYPVFSHVYIEVKIQVYLIPFRHRSKNSWYHRVFTLNTKVKTHSITVYSQCIQVELQENQVETFEGYPVPKDCVSQSMKVKFGTE